MCVCVCVDCIERAVFVQAILRARDDGSGFLADGEECVSPHSSHSCSDGEAQVGGKPDGPRRKPRPCQLLTPLCAAI